MILSVLLIWNDCSKMNYAYWNDRSVKKLNSSKVFLKKEQHTICEW